MVLAIAHQCRTIHKDPKWLKIEQDKSKKWKVSLDSAISIDAAFMANEEIRNDKK